MKLCTKKIYCRSCRKLVRGQEQKVNHNSTRVVCSRCGSLICFWNGLSWRFV